MPQVYKQVKCIALLKINKNTIRASQLNGNIVDRSKNILDDLFQLGGQNRLLKSGKPKQKAYGRMPINTEYLIQKGKT